MAFYDIFESLCTENGVTPTQVARDNGIKQSVVAMWKKRDSTPKAETVQKLADYFGVSVDYLLGLRPLPDDLADVFLNRNIGQNIKDLRKAAGVTPKELSEKTGIPLAYLRSFENGTGGYFPTEDDLLRIAMVFRISVKDLKGTSVTQEWMLETMERNKKLQEDDPPVKNITFNATPDPEWVELERKMEDGTITPDEAQRYKELMDQANESLRRMIPQAKQRLLDMMERLSDSDLRVVTAMVKQMIAERPPATTQPVPSEAEGKDTPAPADSAEDCHEDEWDRYSEDRYGGRRDE